MRFFLLPSDKQYPSQQPRVSQEVNLQAAVRGNQVVQGRAATTRGGVMRFEGAAATPLSPAAATHERMGPGLPRHPLPKRYCTPACSYDVL